MRIIDLSLPVNRRMTGIPANRLFQENPTRCVALSVLSQRQMVGLKETGVEVAEDAEISHAMMSRLEILTHIGTHIDAPCHFLDDTWSIDQVPLELTVKRGKVIPLSHLAPKSPVTADAILAAGVDFDASVIPVLHTGWTDRAWGTERFWDEMIYLDPSAGELLVERGVSAVALDFFPEAPRWLGIGATDEPPGQNHRILLGNRTIIIQMLTNIDAVGTLDFTLVAVPLRLEGLDGSPARVFAMIG